MNFKPTIKSSFYLMLFFSVVLGTKANSQSWEQLNDPPFRKHHTNGFGYNGKAYVFEGTNNEANSKEVWEYDAAADTWTRIADFPGSARSIAIGDEWNDKYYYGFGSSASGDLSDLWEFDPTTRSYTQLPSCPCIGRAHPAFIAHNDKIYMGSGSSDEGDVDDWWEYDMNTQVWTQKQDIPGGNRHHPFFFGIDNKVYVGGGHRNNWLEYDLDTEEWIEIDNAPQGRVAGTQLQYNGLGIIVAGDDAAHNHVPTQENFMLYDPQSGEWIYMPPVPNQNRWAPSSFIIEEDLYFFGGITFGNTTPVNDSSMWKFDLTTLSCLPAQGLDVTSLLDTSANLIWSGNTDVSSDTLKWRAVGNTDWNIIPNPPSIYPVTNLEACHEYEYQITNNCEGQITYSDVFLFTTDGCCTNPNLSLSLDGNTSTLDWADILGAQTFDLRWKKTEDTEWETASVSENMLDLGELEECTEYEFQIKSVCTIEDIDFSESQVFTTKGCGFCLDYDYCLSESNLQGGEYHIDEVRINTYVNNTGNNNGYANFVVPDTEVLNAGETFNLSLVPANVDDFGVGFYVWIDFDLSGTFDSDELVFSDIFITEEISTDILIPADVTSETIRMRIVLNEGFTPIPCDSPNSIDQGEVEDYCLAIIGTSSTSEQDLNALSVTASPNPFYDILNIEGELNSEIITEIVIHNTLGEEVKRFTNDKISTQLNLSQIPDGIYFLSINNKFKVLQTIKIVKN